MTWRSTEVLLKINILVWACLINEVPDLHWCTFAGDRKWLCMVYSQSWLYKTHEPVRIMCLYFFMYSIFILFSYYTKSFKSEKGHAGHTWRYWSNASALFACCLLCNSVCPSPSSAACTLCTVMYSLLSPFCLLLFLNLSNWLTWWHIQTQITSSPSCPKSPKCLIYLDVSVLSSCSLAEVYLILSGVTCSVIPVSVYKIAHLVS